MNRQRRCATYIQWNITQPQKKNEIMPFAATLMDLVMIVQSEVSQRQISYDITYVWNLIKKKKIQMNLFTKQK